MRVTITTRFTKNSSFITENTRHHQKVFLKAFKTLNNKLILSLLIQNLFVHPDELVFDGAVRNILFCK